MSKFTPGKWKVKKCNVLGHKAIIHAGDFIDATNCTGNYIATVHTIEDAQLMAHAKEMYEQLQDVMNTICGVLELIPDTVDTHDLQVEADLIDDLLTRIDGSEAKS
ncbi:MAG: hypothetical protein IJP48_07715 [Synergistaceae bacterium]|nr:hypothetical protein [Synergistaceae bacterium]